MSKCLLILLLLLSGCSKNEKYLRSYYHNDLVKYLNLNNTYDLISFGIIDENYEDAELDTGYLIYTLANYITTPSKFVYEEDDYIDFAIRNGLISTFKKKYVNRDEAQQLFELATQIKERNIGNYDNSEYKESFNEDSEIDEIYESIDFEYNNDLDLSNAEIIEYFNYTDDELTEDENYRMLGETLASKSYKLGDYKISYVVTDTDIRVKAENEKLNGKFYIQSEINNLKLQAKLKANSSEDYTYFKVSFKTLESLGFKKGTYKDRYADLKSIDKNNILNSLSKMFKTKSEIAETTIDLFEINLPVDKLGVLKVTLQVKLHFYASGRVEMTFETDNAYGFERVDDNIRYISDMDKSLDFLARASSDTTTSLTVGLKSNKTRIADIRFEAGVSGFVKNTIHIYDDDMYNTFETKLPGDYVDDMLKDDPDFKVCSDLSLYWLLKVIINSSGSLLNKTGLTHTFDVFKDNKQLIRGPVHLENFLEVDKCTVRNKTKTETETIKVNKEKLLPAVYFKSLKIDETFNIQFKEIPDGYSLKDLVYFSNDSSIVKVTDDGTVKALKKGSAEINIRTIDQKYETSVSVLINE